MKRFGILLIFFAMAGCATIPKNYTSIKHDVKSELKGADNDKALKIGCLIYNAHAVTESEKTARRIAWTEYRKILSRKRSKAIKDSGVFQLKEEELNVKKMPLSSLIKTYKSIEDKAIYYRNLTSAERSEEDRGWQIIYATADKILIKESRRRDFMNQSMDIVVQILAIAASVAAAAI